MCVKNNKDFGITNGKMYTITSIEKDVIIVNKYRFTDLQFAQYFVVAYAVTNHKVQGITIRENYNIYEWANMVVREKYTAYSRTANADYVKIIKDYKPNFKLWKELEGYFASNYVVYKWSCLNDENIYIGITNEFKQRREEHIKACNDDKHKNHNNYIYQYIRSHGGIDKWKMEVVESFYAESIREAQQKEQTYIFRLEPKLNSINSYNDTE